MKIGKEITRFKSKDATPFDPPILLLLTGDKSVGARHRCRMRRRFLLQIVLIVMSEPANIRLLPAGLKAG